MNVGFAGVGTMGGAMARRLIEAGHHVTAFDTSPRTMQELEEQGAVAAPSCADLGAGADIVHVVVFTDEQVRAVVAGEGGLLAGNLSDTIVVVHSTVRPDTCRELAEKVRTVGGDLMDAAMTGTATAAQEGTLTLLLGGRTTTMEACSLVLSTLASRVVHVGDVGMGALAKILNNFLVLANSEVLRQALQLGTAAGADEAAILDVLQTATGRSWVSDNWAQVGPIVQQGPISEGYARMSVKDCRLAQAEAERFGVLLPAADLVLTRLTEIGRVTAVEGAN